MPDSAASPERKAPSDHKRFSITMDRIQDYEFRVKFDKEQHADLLMDEPPPIGGDKAPSASRVLAAAIGNCLSASLLFCLTRARADVSSVHTDVTVEMARNEKGRLRIGKVEVVIDPQFVAPDPDRLSRCLELFEDFCVVTQSVRQGIDVRVTVRENAG